MSDSHPKKYIFLEPYEYSNQFIDELKLTFIALGYKVEPFKSIEQYASVPKSSKIAVINWLEDQPSYNQSHFQAWLDFLRVIKKALLIKLKMNRVIWIQHNFRPHNREYGQTTFHFTQTMFSFLKFKKLVMERSAVGDNITHPLYLSDKQNDRLQTQLKSFECEGQHDVLFFGAIKKYKNLHEILQYWPVDLTLRVIGSAESQDYVNQLREIVARRALSVVIENRFIESEELDNLLKSYKWVLVPHANNTMVASGSFYHAISYGCNAICNASEFGLLKSKQHEFVQVIDQQTFSNGFLEKHFVPKHQVLAQVLEHYGEQVRLAQWDKVLND